MQKPGYVSYTGPFAADSVMVEGKPWLRWDGNQWWDKETNSPRPVNFYRGPGYGDSIIATGVPGGPPVGAYFEWGTDRNNGEGWFMPPQTAPQQPPQAFAPRAVGGKLSLSAAAALARQAPAQTVSVPAGVGDALTTAMRTGNTAPLLAFGGMELDAADIIILIGQGYPQFVGLPGKPPQSDEETDIPTRIENTAGYVDALMTTFKRALFVRALADALAVYVRHNGHGVKLKLLELAPLAAELWTSISKLPDPIDADPDVKTSLDNLDDYIESVAAQMFADDRVRVLGHIGAALA